MGLFDSFFSSQPAPAPAPQSGVNNGAPPGATSSTNTTVPPADASGVPAGTPAAASPLDPFADLWKPSTEPDNFNAPTFGNIDPKTMMDAAKKTNFGQVVTKEQRAAIAAGGEQAVEAFVNALNSVSQTVYANSAMASTRLIDQALQKQREAFEAKLPTIIKQHTLSNNLREENPVFNNPAVQPLITAMERQLALKHPNATAAELTKMAKDYVGGLGAAFSPTAPTAEGNNNSKPADYDWSQFIP